MLHVMNFLEMRTILVTNRQGGEQTWAQDNSNSNALVVPQANAALDQLKYEVAQELGIAIPQDGYYG